MMEISTDAEFRTVLAALPILEQRRVGALFVERVLNLSDNARVRDAIHVLRKPRLGAEELQDAYRVAKAAAVESYTICGKDADWLRQAGHFVAAAATACLGAEDPVATQKTIAWTAAMNTRMAENCAAIAQGGERGSNVAATQYQLLKEYLETR